MSVSNFKLNLELKKKSTNEHVCHKIDGQRFGHTNTVKLNVSTVYDVKVTLRPALQLNKLIIQGETHDLEVGPGQEDDDKRIYSATYHTVGHDNSKKGKRKELPFVFELENGVSLSTKLQCKFYNESEADHSKWGNKLTCIEYECQVSEGHSYVTVTKERYL